MSLWGIFHDEEGVKHVAPCDRAWLVLAPHTVQRDCECRPEVDEKAAVRVWVHNDLGVERHA